MKGRGTRRAVFSYEDETKEKFEVPKKAFKLFDFFAVCEYFEEKFNYDEQLKLPPTIGRKNVDEEERTERYITDDLELGRRDDIQTIKEEQIGNEGMRVDREVWGEKAKEAIEKDQEISELYKSGDIYGAEKAVIEKHFEKPKLYISRSKFKQAFKLDRRPHVKEILEYVFGDRDNFQSKDEIVSDEFESFVQNEGITPDQYSAARDVFSAYTTDPHVRELIDEGRFAELDFTGLKMDDWINLAPELRKRIPEYARDYVLEKVAD